MFTWTRDRILVAALVTIHGTAMIAVTGFVLGWWSSGDSDEEASLVPISGATVSPGIDGPTVTPDSSAFLATATPGRIPEAAASPTPPPPTATSVPPTATSIPPTSPPQLAPTNPPVPPSPAAPAASPADFSGQWRIVDVVTQGSNEGQTFSFDVSLSQQGNQVSGGNGGIQMSGIVQGDTATVEYVQPALGYTGTFAWTMIGPNQAAGTFTNSYPNSGTSTLQRLR